MDITRLNPGELAKILARKGLSEERAKVVIDNEISGYIFVHLTDDDVHRMFPGKIGVVRWILLTREAILAEGCILDEKSQSNDEAWDVVVDVIPELDALEKNPSAAIEYNITNLLKANQSPNISSDGHPPPCHPPQDTDAVNSSLLQRQNIKTITRSKTRCHCSLLPQNTEPSDGSLLQIQTAVSLLSSHDDSENNSIPLPAFSSHIQEALRSGDILPKFHELVEECTLHILRHGDIRNKAQYARFGKEMYRQYKCIGFPTHNKQHPWSFLCEKLSQKLRNTRWKQTHKISNGVLKRNRNSHPQASLQLEDKEPASITLESAKRDLKDEMEKSCSNLNLMKQLFRFLLQDRRTRLTSIEKGDVTAIIEEFPLLANIVFIREDFINQYITNKDIIYERYIDMLQRLDFIFNETVIVDKNAGHIQDDVFLQISLLLKLQDELDNSRLSKATTGQAIQVVEVDSLDLSKLNRSAPTLLIVRDEVGISQGLVLAENVKVSLETTEAVDCLVTFLTDFMACYYAWNMRYPKSFQILGFLQDHILDDKDSGFFRSSNYKKFDKIFCEAF